MLNIVKELLTPANAILGAVIIFVTGQMVTKFLIEPIAKYNKLREEIVSTLILYWDIILNPNDAEEEELNKVSQVLRQKAGILMAVNLATFHHFFNLYNFFAFFRIVPKYKYVVKASKKLIELSESVRKKEVESNLFRIREAIDAINIRSSIERVLDIRTGERKL